MHTQHEAATARRVLSKVPEVTIFFWIIKVLCTTVGESAADFLNVNLNLGLTGTSLVTGVLLAVALVFQVRVNRYVPALYWLTVALLSVFGTLITDNLTDVVGLPLEVSTLLFGGLLALTFIAWYASEKTLAIHSIYTRRREAFYWLAVLFTFALGTATGDLMAEALGLGYLATGFIVVTLIALTALAWRLGLNSILAFWIVYILTRPLGASTGDYLSQPAAFGGLGLGVTVTSLIFVLGILAVVLYLTVTKADVERGISAPGHHETVESGGLWQTVVVVCLVVIVGGSAYHVRKATLQDEAAADTPSEAVAGPGGSTPVAHSPLGDMTKFRVITQDTLDLLTAGQQSDATTRIGDLELEWDNSQAILKARDNTTWTEVDGKIDTVLRELRATSPSADSEKAALVALLAELG
jgi:uncharacterized membrane-anchored protein